MSVCRLVQMPLQLVSGDGHAQLDAWQVMPPLQLYAAPQPPQSLASGWLFVASLTHAPPQSVNPLPVQLHVP
jgi:hypothetical protein